MTSPGLKMIFMGSPDFACPTLAKLIESQHDVCHVLTQPPRAAGRGLSEVKTAVAQLAEQHHIPTSWPTSLSNQEIYEKLHALQADLFVVVAYGLLLPKSILDLPPLGALNGHASLLPRWRGAAPIQRAIQAGDSTTGICAMMMEEGLDTGPVILQNSLDIAPMDTAQSLHDRLADLTAQTLLDAISEIQKGTAIAHPQAEEGVCYAHKITKSEAEIDFTQSAVSLKHHIHAFSPFPGGFITGASGKRLKCLTAETLEDETKAPAGTYVGCDDDGLLVACGDGQLLRLLSVQPAGKKPMSAIAFANGRHLMPGTMLESHI